MNLEEFHKHLPSGNFESTIRQLKRLDPKQALQLKLDQYKKSTAEPRILNEGATGNPFINPYICDDPISTARLVQIYLKEWPRAWEICQGRTFKHVDGFHDYRAAYCRFVPHVATFITHETNKPTTEKVLADGDLLGQLGTFVLLKHQGHPVFFLSKALCEAVAQTKIDFVVDWLELGLPFHAFTFVFPKNIPIMVEGSPVIYITISLLTKTTVLDVVCKELIKLSDEQIDHLADAPDICLRFDIETENGRRFLRSHAKPYDPAVNDTPEDVVVAGSTPAHEVLSEITQIVFNILFVMNARPEYVEQGARVSVHKKSKSEIWTPNVIGSKYRVKTAKGESSGLHVRLHWRRGHWRRQPFGVGLTQVKRIWIEPMMIGGNAYQEN